MHIARDMQPMTQTRVVHLNSIVSFKSSCHFYSCPFFWLIFLSSIWPPNPLLFRAVTLPTSSHEILPNSAPTPLNWAWAFVSSGSVQEILPWGRDPVLNHLPNYQISVIFQQASLRWMPHAAHEASSLSWLLLAAQRQVSSHLTCMPAK